jgi:hypothetical protein
VRGCSIVECEVGSVVAAGATGNVPDANVAVLSLDCRLVGDDTPRSCCGAGVCTGTDCGSCDGPVRPLLDGESSCWTVALASERESVIVLPRKSSAGADD